MPEAREVAITPTSHDALIRVHSTDREHALSMGRSYSPSVASSIGTRFAPSIRSLEVDDNATMEEEVVRVKARFDNVRKAILDSPTEYPNDTWTVPVTLVAGQQDKQKWWESILAFDSRCRFNLISTRIVEREALEMERIEEVHVADTMTGLPIYCLGYINITVWFMVEIQSQLGREPTFLPRCYNVRFLVVESNTFDMIIGHRTMEDEKMYRDKDMIVSWRSRFFQ